MQLMQMILLSTVQAICLAGAVGGLTYVMVERPDVREELGVYIAGGLCVAGMLASTVMLLSL